MLLSSNGLKVLNKVPGPFARKPFRPQDVPPPVVSPPGRFAPPLVVSR